MKIIFIICLLFSMGTNNINCHVEENRNDLISIRIPNLAAYSTPVEVYSEFGANSGCKISLFENNTAGEVLIQYSIDNKQNWQTLRDGQYIKSQSVWCKAKGLGGSGSVTLKIQ